MSYIGQDTDYGFLYKQQLTANTGTQDYTLDYHVVNSSGVIVVSNNKVLEPTIDYVATGNNLHIRTAPTTGQNLWVIILSQEFINGSIPVPSSIKNNKIDSLVASKLTGTLPVMDGSSLSVSTTTKDVDPTVTENPSSVGTFFINKTSGEMWVCTDVTTDQNVWINIGRSSGNITYTPPGFQAGSFGYIGGGYPGGPVYLGTLDKMTFSTESISNTGQLLGGHNQGSSDTYGAGSGSDVVAYCMSGGGVRLDAVTFANDTVTALSSPRPRGSGACTDYNGSACYWGTGNLGGGSSDDVYKLTWSNNSVTNLGSILTYSTLNGDLVSSSSKAYIIAGTSGSTPNPWSSAGLNVDTMSFDTNTINVESNLFDYTAAGKSGACETQTHAYVARDGQPDCRKLNFDTHTRSILTSWISYSGSPRAMAGSIGGYWKFSGRSGSNLEKIEFSSDTRSALSATLSQNREWPSMVSQLA